jgi:putative adenylate-forming enzyme
LEAHQRRCAAKLRRWALERSPFYQRFHRGLENQPLSRLPILSKGELMENFDQLVTDRSVRLAEVEAFLRQTTGAELFQGRYVVLATSGSTGRRGIFLFDHREWIHVLAMITRPLAWSGMNPNPFRPRRAAMIASTVPWHYSSRVSHSLSSRLLPSLRIDASEPLDRVVKDLNRWQPELLGAYPSVLRPLVEEQLAGRLSIPVRYVATSAEVLTAETRARVQQVWNAQISDTYGGPEYAPIAAECAYGRKHLLEDSAIIEMVDGKGQPVPTGEYCERVLLTVFHRFTQPLIRYEISDMVRSANGDCECGRPFQLIDSIEGRTEDVLKFPAGDGSSREVAVHPNIFHELLETLPVAGWQVIQSEDALRIFLLGTTAEALAAVNVPALTEFIRRRLEKHGALPPPIEVEHVSALSRGATGKAPLIQSRLKRSEVAM